MQLKIPQIYCQMGQAPLLLSTVKFPIWKAGIIVISPGHCFCFCLGGGRLFVYCRTAWAWVLIIVHMMVVPSTGSLILGCTPCLFAGWPSQCVTRSSLCPLLYLKPHGNWDWNSLWARWQGCVYLGSLDSSFFPPDSVCPVSGAECFSGTAGTVGALGVIAWAEALSSRHVPSSQAPVPVSWSVSHNRSCSSPQLATDGLIFLGQANTWPSWAN